MKFFAPAILASTAVWLAAAATFAPVALEPPLNWVSGSYLFPGEIIAGYNDDVDSWTQADWDAHVLAECQTFAACTSSITFQGEFGASFVGIYISNVGG